MDDGSGSSGTISAEVVRLLLGSAPLEGGELADILRLAGIDPGSLGGPHARFPIEQFAVLWSGLERAAGDPDLGLHLGELRDGFPTGHVLFAALANSPTVGQALERYCRYHDIMGDFVRPQLTARGPFRALTLSTRPGVRLHRQHVEFIFCFALSLLRRLCDQPLSVEVRFAHPRPSDVSEHRRIFGQAVFFDRPAHELAIPRAYLEHPIAAADPELLGVLERYAERLLKRVRPTQSWSDRVTRQLSRDLCDGTPRLPDVARALAVSSRSLQGKLKAEGTTFQALLDGLRKELATAYLEDGELTLAEIAFLLGYADQSAFTHAFRKWTGATPLSFRGRLPCRNGRAVSD